MKIIKYIVILAFVCMCGCIDKNIAQPVSQSTTDIINVPTVSESVSMPVVTETPVDNNSMAEVDHNSTTEVDLGYAIIVGADGHHIHLVHNTYATDKTYNEVINFILQDPTDKKPYIDDVYTCGDYAENVQNNAEAAGIKCGYVCIDFEDGYGHACNYFDTTDKGRVYIDCTMYDSISEIKTGELYQPRYIVSHNDMEHSHTLSSMGVISKYSETDDIGVTKPHL